jgi:FMN phosphatase YigB (HAD superfamily)
VLHSTNHHCLLLNKPDYFLPRIVNSITTSWEVGTAKPSKEAFEAAARKLGVLPSETLMVGDDLDEDYEAAKEAGMQAVMLHRTKHDADYVRREVGMEELKDVDVVTSLRDLPDWLERHAK